MALPYDLGGGRKQGFHYWVLFDWLFGTEKWQKTVENAHHSFPEPGTTSSDVQIQRYSIHSDARQSKAGNLHISEAWNQHILGHFCLKNTKYQSCRRSFFCWLINQLIASALNLHFHFKLGKWAYLWLGSISKEDSCRFFNVENMSLHTDSLNMRMSVRLTSSCVRHQLSNPLKRGAHEKHGGLCVPHCISPLP